MSKQFTSALYATPTWTDSALAAFSAKELDQLASATSKMVVTQKVKMFLAQPGMERTPSNEAAASAYLAQRFVQGVFRPSRVETQIGAGTLTCTKDELTIITDKGEKLEAKAAVVPTFHQKARSGLDVLCVALVAISRINQGTLEMVVTPQQWQTAFGEPSSSIRVSGLRPFYVEYKKIMEDDVTYQTTVKAQSVTLAGFQYVDFVHTLLLRMSAVEYVFLHGVYTDKFLAAFDRVETKGVISLVPVKIARRVDGARTVVNKIEPQCFQALPEKAPGVKEAMDIMKTKIYMYKGGATMGMSVNKKDGTLATAMKVASSQMQIRGGTEGGLGTFTASLGIGNLMAPGTRRQTLLVAMAQTAQSYIREDQIDSDNKALNLGEDVEVADTVAIHCQPGDALAVVSSMQQPFCIIMSYEDQRKCKFPESIAPTFFTTPPANAYQVWHDDAPLASSEEDRQLAYKLFSERIADIDYICWTAAWDPVLQDENAVVYPLPGRGSPDFKAIVSSISDMKLRFDVGSQKHTIPLKEHEDVGVWNDYVIQSNIQHTSFLLKPKYCHTALTNLLSRPRVARGTAYQTDEGAWVFSDLIDIYLGEEDDEVEEDDIEEVDEDEEDAPLAPRPAKKRAAAPRPKPGDPVEDAEPADGYEIPEEDVEL